MTTYFVFRRDDNYVSAIAAATRRAAIARLHVTRCEILSEHNDWAAAHAAIVAARDKYPQPSE